MEKPSPPAHAPPTDRSASRLRRSVVLPQVASSSAGVADRLNSFLAAWRPTQGEALTASRRSALLAAAGEALGAMRVGLLVLDQDGVYHGQATVGVDTGRSRCFRSTAVAVSELSPPETAERPTRPRDYPYLDWTDISTGPTPEWRSRRSSPLPTRPRSYGGIFGSASPKRRLQRSSFWR